MSTFTLAFRKLTPSTPENPPEFDEENVMYIASIYEGEPPSENDPFNIGAMRWGLTKKFEPDVNTTYDNTEITARLWNENPITSTEINNNTKFNNEICILKVSSIEEKTINNTTIIDTITIEFESLQDWYVGTPDADVLREEAIAMYNGTYKLLTNADGTYPTGWNRIWQKLK